MDLYADGSINLNEQSGQFVYKCYHKNKYLLDPLIRLYNGIIKILRSK